MIGLRVKTTGDLARQLRTGYILPSLVYPAIRSTKLAAFVVRHNAGRKRAGHAINDGTCVHHFLSTSLATYTCSESGKIYRMQHFWYNVVMPCFASFSRFRFFLILCNHVRNCPISVQNESTKVQTLDEYYNIRRVRT